MRTTRLFQIVVFALLTLVSAHAQPRPEKVYLFSYSTGENRDKNGLHFAWSADQQTWHEIGPLYSFVKSDYGDWGSQKRMLNPRVVSLPDGSWDVIFEVNEKEAVMGIAHTPNFVNWIPQEYLPSAKVLSMYNLPERVSVELPISGKQTGDIHCVEWNVLKTMLDAVQMAATRSAENAERLADDAGRFRGLKSQTLTLSIDADKPKQISNMLMGIFFEDINYAADGGLYAELVQNRDFEYHPRDKRHRDSKWNSSYAWTLTGEGAQWFVDQMDPLHANNPNYARIRVARKGARFANDGFDGIAVKAGEKYDVSFFARAINGGGTVTARIVDENGAEIGKAGLSARSRSWKKSAAVIVASRTCDNARLELELGFAGEVALDMISLFPQNTFKGRKNGLRPDLAQALADLKPRFVRFPGGCVAHGDGLENMYRWKNTIGPLEQRVPNWNIWGYHQSLGLGYYEYFQMCEDLDAEPVPIIPAAVPCQNSVVGGYGQQGGLPLEEMDEYIQDIVDLVEWANGDPKKSKWAKIRADAGHPEPFNLKYIGIGNEDLITKVFEERFEMIYKALKERCPEITVIGTVGPFYQGADYEEGWRFAQELGLELVDEHYYNPPGWFINNQDFYDKYPRGGTKVYLGEYASHLPNRSNCLESALTEAAYLCHVERNADVVEMTSYAPLLAKKGHTQWNPDLIYFTNTTVEPTTGYYVQALFGQNAGDVYLPSAFDLDPRDASIARRLASSVVLDSSSGDLIVKLVNMLPVDNTVEVALPSEYSRGNVTKSLLTGELSDTAAQPVVSKANVVSGACTVTLPAYSFMVIRVSK